MLLFILLGLPIIAILLSVLGKKNLQISEAASFVSAFLQVVVSFVISYCVIQNNNYIVLPFFSVDALGALCLVVTSVAGFASVAYNIGYIREEVKKRIIFDRAKQSYILINLFLAAMFFAITLTNPILTWISIEATTLSTVFLISFYNRPSTIEAAWKYLVINSVGLMLGFLGTIIFFALVSNKIEGNFLTWQDMLSVAATLNPAAIRMAFIFILIGYGTKLGIAPMHTWRPDAYSKAPIPVVALLSGALLNVAFLSILRFKLITDAAVGVNFSQNLFIFFGALSVLVASFAIFQQKNYKRLLAYSSVEHAGIMLLGFGFGGLGVYAALLHMVYHSLVKSCLFLLSGNIFLKYGSTKIKDITGVIQIMPKTGILFLVGALALTGIPPFGLFLTKLYIIIEGIKTYPLITILLVFSIALIFVGFFRLVSGMVFGDMPKGIKVGEYSLWTLLPPLALLLVLIIISFMVPEPLQTLLIQAASSFTK